MENVSIDVITTWVKQGCTYEKISDELKRMFPNTPGLSSRSVRRFCSTHGIKRMSQEELDDTVKESVSEVFDVYALFICC